MGEFNSSRMDLHGQAGWGHIPAQPHKTKDLGDKLHRHCERRVDRVQAVRAMQPNYQPMSIKPVLRNLWWELASIDPSIHYPAAHNSCQADDELENMFDSSKLTIADLKTALTKMPYPNHWATSVLNDPDFTRFLSIDSLPLNKLKATLAAGLAKHIQSATLPVYERPVKKQVYQPVLLKSSDSLKGTDKKQAQPIYKTKKPAPSDNNNTELTRMQNSLKDLWGKMVKKDSSLPFPQLNEVTKPERTIVRMFSSSKVTFEDLNAALRALQTTHPWAASMLETQAVPVNKNTKSKPVFDFRYALTGRLLRHIRANSGKLAAADLPENPKGHNPLPGARREDPAKAKGQPQDAHKKEYKNHLPLKELHHSDKKVFNGLKAERQNKKNQNKDSEARPARLQGQRADRQVAQAKVGGKQLKHRPLPELPVALPLANKMAQAKVGGKQLKHRPLPELPVALPLANKKPQGPAEDPRPVMVKKSWKNNRVEKGGDRPFTEVQAETPNGKQLFTAELLNTVPDTVLKANGWSMDDISGMKVRRKAHPMSSTALKALGCNNVVSGFQGRYYGEGAYGKVKQARITLPGTTQKKWCVAKKVKIKTKKELNNVLKETRLQAQSGVGPKIYGVADTTNKYGERQCIIFMEKIDGMEGHKFLKEKQRSMSFSNKIKLAELLIQQVVTMHQNNVFHSDMKWENSGVDPDTLSVQLLDFGMGTSAQHQDQPAYYAQGPGYSPPELVIGRKNSRGYLDMEKADVYSLGVMLGQLFGSETFMYFAWHRDNVYTPQSQLDRELSRSGITDSRIQSLIEQMVQADPDKRPTMKEVIEQARRLKTVPALGAVAPRHCGFAPRPPFTPLFGRLGFVH